MSYDVTCVECSMNATRYDVTSLECSMDGVKYDATCVTRDFLIYASVPPTILI